MGDRVHVRNGQAAKQRRKDAAAARQQVSDGKKRRLAEVVQFAADVTGDDLDYATARLLAKD